MAPGSGKRMQHLRALGVAKELKLETQEEEEEKYLPKELIA